MPEFMKEPSKNTGSKKAAGEFAAKLVKEGMVIGLGTGSTVAYTIIELGKSVRSGLKILGIPTSYESEFLAIENGIALTTLDEHPEPDIAIDGADMVTCTDNGFAAIKGGGAAHTREKIIAQSAGRFIVIVDESKVTGSLEIPVPLEVLPFSRKLVEKQVTVLGGKPGLRKGSGKDGPIITDNGNFVMDADFGQITDPFLLSEKLDACTGIVEHGIFTKIDSVYVGKKDGSVEKL